MAVEKWPSGGKFNLTNNDMILILYDYGIITPSGWTPNPPRWNDLVADVDESINQMYRLAGPIPIPQIAAKSGGVKKIPSEQTIKYFGDLQAVVRSFDRSLTLDFGTALVKGEVGNITLESEYDPSTKTYNIEALGGTRGSDGQTYFKKVLTTAEAAWAAGHTSAVKASGADGRILAKQAATAAKPSRMTPDDIMSHADEFGVVDHERNKRRVLGLHLRLNGISPRKEVQPWEKVKGANDVIGWDISGSKPKQVTRAGAQAKAEKAKYNKEFNKAQARTADVIPGNTFRPDWTVRGSRAKAEHDFVTTHKIAPIPAQLDDWVRLRERGYIASEIREFHNKWNMPYPKNDKCIRNKRLGLPTDMFFSTVGKLAGFTRHKALEAVGRGGRDGHYQDVYTTDMSSPDWNHKKTELSKNDKALSPIRKVGRALTSKPAKFVYAGAALAGLSIVTVTTLYGLLFPNVPVTPGIEYIYTTLEECAYCLGDYGYEKIRQLGQFIENTGENLFREATNPATRAVDVFEPEVPR